MLTFNEWATKLEWAAVRAKNELEIPTEAVMAEAEIEAKKVIGTYLYGWPQLAPSTQADRVHHGYAANEPLLRTGEMRDSIEHKTTIEPYGSAGVLGSYSLIALWQEMGTSRIPPRPFLGGAMMRAGPLIEITFGKFTMNLLTFGGTS